MVVKSSLIVKSEQEQNLAESFPQGSQSFLIYERDFFNLSKLMRVSPNGGGARMPSVLQCPEMVLLVNNHGMYRSVGCTGGCVSVSHKYHTSMRFEPPRS